MKNDPPVCVCLCVYLNQPEKLTKCVYKWVCGRVVTVLLAVGDLQVLCHYRVESVRVT